jgi:hypothetical protein
MSTEADQNSVDDVQVELPAANHEISINYSCHYQDSLKIDDGRVIESTDTDGYYTPDQEIFCECGETFDSRAEAREHLETALKENRILPYPDLPPQLSWLDETVTVGPVDVVPNKARYIAKVEQSAEYFQETARETLIPPESYGFDGWGELEAGGRLHHEECGPLFRGYALRNALCWVTGRAAYYQPEDYTLHFRGEELLLVEGPDRAAVVAPMENGN